MSSYASGGRDAITGLSKCAGCGASIKEPHYGETTDNREPICISCAARPSHRRTIGSKLREKRPGSTPSIRADLTDTEERIIEFAEEAPFLSVEQATHYLDTSDVYIRKTLREYHKS